MLYLKYIIAILISNATKAQQKITNYEGYDNTFTQNKLDNFIQLHCEAYNLPIIVQKGNLEKVISLKDFKPFAQTKIFVEFIVPLDSKLGIRIWIFNNQ